MISGQASSYVFTRHGQNQFEIESRIVDTRKALAALGFKPAEVKEAIARARTHVGLASLPLEQWIRIALGYCPKPR